MTKDQIAERLRKNARHADLRARTAKRVSVKLRAEGRAEAYWTALALVEQVKGK